VHRDCTHDAADHEPWSMTVERSELATCSESRRNWLQAANCSGLRIVPICGSADGSGRAGLPGGAFLQRCAASARRTRVTGAVAHRIRGANTGPDVCHRFRAPGHSLKQQRHRATWTCSLAIRESALSRTLAGIEGECSSLRRGRSSTGVVRHPTQRAAASLLPLSWEVQNGETKHIEARADRYRHEQDVCEAGRARAVQRDGRRGAIAERGSAAEREEDRALRLRGSRRPTIDEEAVGHQ